MSTDQKIIASGTLGENGDTFFIMMPNKMLLVDAPFAIDLILTKHTVSVVDRMGIPHGSPGITKLIIDRIVSHEAIAIRAYDIFKSGKGRSQDDNWYRAERELLGL